MGDALREHTGLARTGPGDDEEWTLGMDDGLVLDGIETLEKVRVRARRAVVEKGSHGAVTLLMRSDGADRVGQSGK